MTGLTSAANMKQVFIVLMKLLCVAFLVVCVFAELSLIFSSYTQQDDPLIYIFFRMLPPHLSPLLLAVTMAVLLFGLYSRLLKKLSVVLLVLWGAYFWLWNAKLLDNIVPGGGECVELVCEGPPLIYELMTLIYPLTNMLVPIAPYIIDKIDKYKQVAVVFLLWVTVSIFVLYIYGSYNRNALFVSVSYHDYEALFGKYPGGNFLVSILSFSIKGETFWVMLNAGLIFLYMQRLYQLGNRRFCYLALLCICFLFLYIYFFIPYSQSYDPYSQSYDLWLLWIMSAIFAGVGVLLVVSWVSKQNDKRGGAVI